MAKNCKVVPFGDSDGLIGAILELKKKDDSELSKIGQNGFIYYEKYFNKNLRIKQLFGLL